MTVQGTISVCGGRVVIDFPIANIPIDVRPNVAAELTILAADIHRMSRQEGEDPSTGPPPVLLSPDPPLSH